MIHYLTMQQVLELHDLAVQEFGGLAGIRDPNLLYSALETPKLAFGGQEIYPSIFEKAAAYLYHIARNHPFIDGNKRTAYFATRVFLEMNDTPKHFKKEDLEEVVIQVAQGNMAKEDLAEFLKTGKRARDIDSSSNDFLLKESPFEEIEEAVKRQFMEINTKKKKVTRRCVKTLVAG